MKQETLGQVFARYRQAEKIKIEKVEKDIKVSKRMLLAIENDDYDIMPDELYIRNIIKTYANYLSLDYNKLLSLFEERKGKQNKEDEDKKKNKKARVYLTPQIVRNILIALIIITFLIYLGWQVKQIYKPPELIVSQPAQNLIINQNYIEINGQTEKEAKVLINEKEVFINSDGEFKATLDLQKGLNIIKISATKKHSKENVIFREVLVQ